MALLKSVGTSFALDIGTNAVRVVQLNKDGNDRWSLVHYGYAPIDSATSQSDSPEAKQKLGEAIMTAVGQSGIKTKDVVIGLPSQKTFTTVIDLPTMPEAELRSTIKYQIDQYIPMPIDDAKVDWVSLGQSLHDPKQIEVLLTSTAMVYAEDRLELVEELGFNVIAAEPDPIAMVRSLVVQGSATAQLLVDVGEQSSDIVMTYGDTPRLIRTVPTGLSALTRAAAQNLNVKEDQARQFIIKFGLAPDRLEGQVFRAIEGILEGFVGELTKSAKFFQTRYPNIPVAEVTLSGYGSSIPRFGDYVASKTGMKVSVANPWQKVRVSQSDQQQLSSVAFEFAAVVGLAQRTES